MGEGFGGGCSRTFVPRICVAGVTRGSLVMVLGSFTGGLALCGGGYGRVASCASMASWA